MWIKQFVDLCVEFWRHFAFWSVLNQEDIGFIRRLGRMHRKMRPGWNWRWPFIERAETVDARTSACICDPQSLRTADGVLLVLRLKVSYAVADARKYFLKVFEPGNNIQDVASGELAALVRNVTAEDLYTGKAVSHIAERVKAAGRRWGVRVFDVELVDCAPARTYRLVQTQITSQGSE